MNIVEENIENLGLTKQRKVVLSVIRGSKKHLTASEVFGRAKERLPSISFATVYNSLRFLKDSGLIGEVSFGNAATRFDRITERHDHAICTACGDLVDLHLDLPQKLISEAAKSSEFEPESMEVTLKGLCPKCKK